MIFQHVKQSFKNWIDDILFDLSVNIAKFLSSNQISLNPNKLSY